MCTALQTLGDRLQMTLLWLKQHALKQSSLARCRRAGWSEMMRWRQHTLVAMQQRLQAYEALLADTPLEILLPSEWLPAQSYAELAFLSMALKPEAVLPALERQCALGLARYRDTQAAVCEVQKQWGQRPCIAGLRLLSIQWVYERWRESLQAFSATGRLKPTAWERAIQIQRLLSYEKKAFFKQCLAQQPGHLLIKRLQSLAQRPLSAEQGLQQIQADKADVMRQVSALEARFTAGQGRWRQWSALVWLSVSQQPDYQLGELAFLSGVRQMDQLTRVSVLREPLPEAMKKNWAGYTGLAFFTIGLSASNYVGYYAHLIGAINRIVFSQVNAWFRVGNTCDRILSRYAVPVLDTVSDQAGEAYPGLRTLAMAFKALARCDEIALLDKERRLQWLTGLGINCLLTPTQPWLPVMVGYTWATAASEAGLYWIDEIARSRHFELEASHLIKVAAHLTIYTASYRQGFLWAYAFQPVQLAPSISEAEALQRLGFFARPATQRAIKDRYYELSLRFHPDKCRGTDCINATTKMAMINEAHDVLFAPVP